jgi:hypothetical protein
MPPIRQQTWDEEIALRRKGVSGSLLGHAKRNVARLGADAGLFAEARFDAQGVLGHVRQPLLGVWGDHDLLTPPEDNPPLFARALRRGGNLHYTFRFFTDADHAAHQTPDGGITRGAALAPGYADLVGSWVRDVTGGRPPAMDAPAPPRQDHPSVDIPPTTWWNSGWAQLAAFALFVVAFTAFPLVALVRRLRGRRAAQPVSGWPRLLAGAGIVAVLGLFVYLVHLISGSAPDPGPVLMGRPLPWLALQGLAVTTVVAGLGTAVAWRGAGASVPAGERVRLGLLLTAGAVFVPWALYWGLLLP